MTNALATTRGTAVAAQTDNPWAKAAAGGGTGFVGQYVKFNGKTGEYTYGTDDEEIAPGTQIIVDFDLITHGYQCWVDDAVVDRQSVPVASGQKIMENELDDHGPYEKHDDGSSDGWQPVHAMPFIIDYADDDNAYLLQLSSMGGIKALQKLYGAYGKTFQSKIDDDGNYMLPFIELDEGSYKSKKKKVGMIHFPIFTIVDWIPRDEVAELIAKLNPDAEPAEEEEEVEEKPARRATAPVKAEKAPAGRRAAAKVEPEEDEKPEVVAEKPAGRRAGGRAQKAEGDAVEAEGIEPEDFGTDEAEEPEVQDEKPARRGRANPRAAAKEEPEEEAEKPSTRAASGRRSRQF